MLTLYKGMPDVVVLPTSTAEVRPSCASAARPGCPSSRAARAPGSSARHAPRGGVMVSLTRMTQILELDLVNRCGDRAARPHQSLAHQRRARARLVLRADPSSQMVSSIGGNVATNAGGPHCLKYGIITKHVLGLEIVTGTGEVVSVGGKAADRPGYDLTGTMVGNEGTFGLVTAITVRLLHLPEAVKTALASFASLVEASEAVSAIIAAGIIPAALEMLDDAMIGAINAAWARCIRTAPGRAAHRARRAARRGGGSGRESRGDLS